MNDPRTADKKLVIRAITPTQNEIIETWERVTGKKVDRKQVSGAELDEQIKSEFALLDQHTIICAPNGCQARRDKSCLSASC